MIIDLTRERTKRRIEQAEAETVPLSDTGRMTDAEYEVQCERIRSLVTELVPLMGLGEYNVRLQLDHGLIDEDGTVMMICSDWRYRWATITASVQQCALQTDEELTYDVLHEGAHVPLSLVRPSGEAPGEHRDREELAATWIGHMAMDFGKRCADQVREEYEAIVAERDATILDLTKKLARATKRTEKEAA